VSKRVSEKERGEAKEQECERENGRGCRKERDRERKRESKRTIEAHTYLSTICFENICVF